MGQCLRCLGLALARDAGYFVPQANVDKLCEYLSKRFAPTTNDAKPVHDTYHEHNETDRCLALYALAMFDKAEPAYCEKLFKTRDKLCPEDRTLIALAYQERGTKRWSRPLLQPGPRDKEKPETWNAFASTAALDGMRLLAWCLSAPQDPAVEKRLTPARRTLGLRRLDHDAGQRVVADGAGRLRTQVEKAAGPASGSVSLGGKSKPFRLGGDRRDVHLRIPARALGAGKEKLALANADGKRTLYVQTKVESRPRGGAALNAAATTARAATSSSARTSGCSTTARSPMHPRVN